MSGAIIPTGRDDIADFFSIIPTGRLRLFRDTCLILLILSMSSQLPPPNSDGGSLPESKKTNGKTIGISAFFFVQMLAVSASNRRDVLPCAN